MKQTTRQPITFKVTDEEKELIESEAKKVSLPTASFIRMFLLKNFRQEEQI